MRLLAIASEMLTLAEARGQRDLAELALELKQELTMLLSKLLELRVLIDDVLESPSLSHTLTKVEESIITAIRDSGSRCVDLDTLMSRLREYTTPTLILALRQLKRNRLVDLDLDVDASGSVRIKVCLRLS